MGPGSGPVRVVARAVHRAPHVVWSKKARPAWLFPGLVVLSVVFVAVFAHQLTPYNPNSQTLTVTLQGPSWAHLLGTDDLGRDELSRLLVATRTSMFAALIAVGTALLLGVVPGVVAGYRGGNIDHLVVWIGDFLLSFPSILLAIGVVAVVGPGLVPVMLTIGVLYSTRFMRVARSVAMESRTLSYVEAALAMRASSAYIIRRHVLVRVLPAVGAAAASTLGLAMLQEATLSFLGLGVTIPNASWGSMLQEGFSYVTHTADGVLIPGLAIIITVYSFNLLADAFHDRSSAVLATIRLDAQLPALLLATEAA
jgi:ABC-type dipeptide/oligopeptide/nickel transport system permease subunit